MLFPLHRYTEIRSQSDIIVIFLTFLETCAMFSIVALPLTFPQPEHKVLFSLYLYQHLLSPKFFCFVLFCFLINPF